MGKIIQNYELKQQLGEGVYAKVYKAINFVTKQQVAIKVVHSSRFKEIPKLEECTINEINILSTLPPCPYIIRYIDMLKTTNNFYFVYEYCNGGTLERQMQKQRCFPQRKALLYFKQMLEAFKVLAKSNIMHRDVKPDNILLHNGMIKVADFGFCKPLEHANDLANTMLGSPIYMAPEVLKGQIYTIKADIWSLGVVLFQMVYGKCPFESKSIAKLINMLDEKQMQLPPEPKVTPTFEKFIKRILIKDYNHRIDWKQIFEYTITEQGDIFPPGQPNQFKNKINNYPQAQFMPSNNVGANNVGINISISNSINSSVTNSINNSATNSITSTNNSVNIANNSHLTADNYLLPHTMYSPKLKNEDRNVMKKKSPYKEFADTTEYNGNYSINGINGGMQPNSGLNNSKEGKPNSQGQPTQNKSNGFNGGNINGNRGNGVNFGGNSGGNSGVNSGGNSGVNEVNPGNISGNNSVRISGNNSIRNSVNNSGTNVLSASSPLSSVSNVSTQKSSPTLSADKSSARLESLIKNHNKFLFLNSLVLELLKLDFQSCIYTGFYLLRAIQKELFGLYDSLKKDALNAEQSFMDKFKEFRNIVEKELQGSKGNSLLIRDCIEDSKQLTIKDMDLRRGDVMRMFVETMKGLNKEDEMIIGLQVFDFLEQGLLVKKQAYERHTKEQLGKQVKLKTSKYDT